MEYLLKGNKSNIDFPYLKKVNLLNFSVNRHFLAVKIITSQSNLKIANYEYPKFAIR